MRYWDAMNRDYFHIYMPLQVAESTPCVVEVVTTLGERYSIRKIDTILDGAVLLEVYPQQNCVHSRDILAEN